MQRIQVTVDDVVPGSPDDAFDIMLKFEEFHNWWPSSLPIKCIKKTENHIGNQVLIQPYPLIKVGWKLHSYDAGREIIIHYFKGMHTGMGVWTFAETDNNQVHISFEIDILPKNRLYRWAYKIFNVEKTHIKQVKMVITALATQIKTIQSTQNVA